MRRIMVFQLFVLYYIFVQCTAANNTAARFVSADEVSAFACNTTYNRETLPVDTTWYNFVSYRYMRHPTGRNTRDTYVSLERRRARVYWDLERDLSLISSERGSFSVL